MATYHKVPILFLGTPSVVCPVLESLLEHPNCRVVAVVTQPPKQKPGTSHFVKSPVHTLASEKGLPVFTPFRCSDPDFQSAIKALEPHVFLTAAFGQMLPQSFLDIPVLGTYNIHPSLLPKYRGAAPVQHTLLNGDTLGGVTVCQTVLAMDAGPILVQKSVPIDTNIQAPQLLSELFELGIQLFLEKLENIGTGQVHLKDQEGLITLAPKINTNQSILQPQQSVYQIHNAVRGLAGWPGTRALVRIGTNPAQWIKILETRLTPAVDFGDKGLKQDPHNRMFAYRGRKIFWPPLLDSKEGTNLGAQLEILKLQLPGKKAMEASDFLNGIKGLPMTLEDPTSNP